MESVDRCLLVGYNVDGVNESGELWRAQFLFYVTATNYPPSPFRRGSGLRRTGKSLRMLRIGLDCSFVHPFFGC